MGQRLNPFGVLQVVHLVRQDLSIAGKRAGLAGARSGLFMEQVRIVKEMRETDKRNGRTGDMVRPRYLVWENVVGAFSSNKGKDFAAVLEEIIKIVEPEAPGSLMAANEKLAADRKALINELCQYCGKYKQAHEGACDGCKWREM